eukprot:655291-Pyramimonas_sp.AAC.1
MKLLEPHRGPNRLGKLLRKADPSAVLLSLIHATWLGENLDPSWFQETPFAPLLFDLNPSEGLELELEH